MFSNKIRFAGLVVTCCLASWCYQSSAQPAAPSGLNKDAMPTNITGPGKQLNDRGIGNPRGKEINIEGGGKLIPFDPEGKNPKTKKEMVEALRKAASKIEEGCTGCDNPKIYFTAKQLKDLTLHLCPPDGKCK